MILSRGSALRGQGKDGLAYRADIDGLRALAILPVVAFHAGLAGFSGGFIGVDIFFVISGFLISSIISREMSEGRFSVLEFYKRRAVRILPSLIVMLTMSSIVAAYVLFPSDLQEFGNSVVATAAFVSNHFFLDKAAYFGGLADEKPLLHTWSLAIEEQFYIIFPWLLLALHHYAARKTRLILAVITAASFVLCVVGSRIAPVTNFYLLPTRAWELGVGSLAALGVFPALPARGLRIGLGAVGLAMILIALYILHPWDIFPGFSALLPCLGAAFIIVYGAGTPINHVLGSRPAVMIGRISYPLYLWHWPVIVFARMKFGISDSPGRALSTIGISLILATISTVMIERRLLPYLRRFPAGRICAAAVALLLLAAAAGLALAKYSDRIRHYDPGVAHILTYAGYGLMPENRYQSRAGTCFVISRASAANFDRSLCMRIDPAKPNYLLIGDSFAAYLWRALSLRFKDANIMQVTAAGCNPLDIGGGRSSCAVFRDVLNGLIAGHGGPKQIILSAHWADDDIPRLVILGKALQKSGHEVLIVGPVMEYRSALPNLLARAAIEHDPDLIVRAQDNRRQQLDHQMQARMASENLPYVSLYDIVCPKDRCRTLAAPGIPMQFDYGHLTLEGSQFVVSRFPDLGAGDHPRAHGGGR